MRSPKLWSRRLWKELSVSDFLSSSFGMEGCCGAEGFTAISVVGLEC